MDSTQHTPGPWHAEQDPDLTTSEINKVVDIAKPYYPGGNTPLHAVKDWAKVASMIDALRGGKKLPIIYSDGPLGSGNWLSGTHRVAASEIRAKLDGTEPYADLRIVDVSPWLEAIERRNRRDTLIGECLGTLLGAAIVGAVLWLAGAL